MISQVDHINIVVQDLERATRFYTDMLGMRVTRRAHLQGEWIERVVGLAGVRADVVYVQPEGGGPRIELIHYAAPAGARLPACALANTVGLRHIALRVDDMDAARQRLEGAGVRFLGPPVAVPLETVSHEAGQKRLCYFHDPDGVLLELAEYRNDGARQGT